METMAFWMTLWKVVFIVAISAFGMVAVWVTVQGARDIKSLLNDLRARHEHGGKSATEE